MKGRPPNNKGIPRSAKAKERFKKTVSNIKGFGKWNIGNITSKETRDKISQSLKGRIPKNLSLLHKLPRNEQWRKKIGLGNKGKVRSEETRKKISEAKRNPLRPLYKAIRECYKYREWRTSIFRRDSFTCVLSGHKGGELNADHYPKRFVDVLKENQIDTLDKALNCEELWNIKNGRTLCKKCHEQTDTWGNKFQRKKE